MSNVISRAPAGIPTGGQFSRHAHLDGPADMLDDAPGLPATAELTAVTVAADPQRAAEDAEIAAMKHLAQSIRAQWPDSEHAFARIDDDGTITLTHVYDAFDGLHATEADLGVTLDDGAQIDPTAGVSATGEWTTNVAKRQVYGGPPNQRSLHIDLYAAAAMPTGPERRLDRARDDISGHVLTQHPDADSWEAEFEYDPATESFVLADEIYVSSGNEFARVNMRREDPGMLDRLSTAAHQALPLVSDETSLQVTIPGPDATWDGYSF